MATTAPTAAVAWGESALQRFEGEGCDPSVIWWATPFQLIPGGSMARAGEAMLGVLGIEASEAPPEEQGAPDGVQYQIRPGAPVQMFGVNETSADALLPYRDLILELYRERGIIGRS